MNNTIHKISNKPKQFDKFIFFFCIIDHMFMPYFWLISIPYSMPLIFYWSFTRYSKIAKDKELGYFQIIFIIMLLSTILGFIVYPSFIYNNIVYLVQYTAMFLYFFMFSYYVKNYDFNIKTILVIFIIVVDVFALLYNINKGLYHNVKLFWNFRSSLYINSTTYKGYIGYRFSYYWMDANNIGYMMNAVIMYLYFNEKTSFFIKVFSLLSVLFVLVSCMSNGALLTFFLILILFVISRIISLISNNLKIIYTFRLSSILMFVVTIVGVYFIIVYYLPGYLHSNVAIESYNRIINNFSTSRFEIWSEIVQKENILKYLFFGFGGVVIVNGVNYAPHNGHFYIILSYGLIAYYFFMYLIFFKRKCTQFKEYIWVFPIFIGFTLNVLLGEIKMMGIILLLVACSSNRNYLESKRV